MTQEEILDELKELNLTTAEFLEIYKTRMYKNQVLTHSDVIALQTIRKENLAGSGFVKWGQHLDAYSPLKGIWLYFIVNGYILGNANSGGVFLDTEGVKTPEVNIGGDLLKVRGVNNSSRQSYILLPYLELPRVIDDFRDSGDELKQGDIVILNNEVDCLTGTYATAANNTVVKVGNNYKITTINDYYYSEIMFKYEGIKDTIYELELEFISSTGDRDKWGLKTGVSTWLYESNYIYNRHQERGIHKVLVKAKWNGVNFINLVLDNTDHLSNRTWEFNINSIKMVKDQGMSITDTIPANSNLSEVGNKIVPIDSISSKDLSFIEKWHEKISDRDVVFPDGNVQNKGTSNIMFDGKPVYSTYPGRDDYSKFLSNGPGIGFGLQWSTLTNDEKLAIASNVDNNIYIKDNDWYQIRYRVRSIKGIGNRCDFDGVSSDRMSYNTLGGEYGVIKAQGANDTPNGINDIGASDTDAYTTSSNYPGSFIVENGALAGKVEAIPLFLVQRSNYGIYHPIHNPEGCGMLFKDGAIHPYDAYPNELTRKIDCFNPDKVGIIKGSDITDCKSFSSFTTGYNLIGVITSTVTGSPVGDFVDVPSIGNYKDLRMDAKKVIVEDILEKHYRELLSTTSIGDEEVKTIRKVVTDLKIAGINNGNVVFKTPDGSTYDIRSDVKPYMGMMYNKSTGKLYHIGMVPDVAWANGEGCSLTLKEGVEDITKDTLNAEQTVGDDIVLICYERRGFNIMGSGNITEIIGDPSKLPAEVNKDGINGFIALNLINPTNNLKSILDYTLLNKGGLEIPISRNNVAVKEVLVYDTVSKTYDRIPKSGNYSTIIENGTVKGFYGDEFIRLNINGDGTTTGYENKIIFITYATYGRTVKPTANTEVVVMKDRAKILSNSYANEGSVLVESLIGKRLTIGWRGKWEVAFRNLSLDSDNKFSDYRDTHPYIPVNEDFDIPVFDNTILKVFPYIAKEGKQYKLNIVYKEIEDSFDSNKFEITDNASTILENGKSIKFGISGVKLPYFIKD